MKEDLGVVVNKYAPHDPFYPVEIEAVSLEQHKVNGGYRLPIPDGARLWKKSSGHVKFYRVLGLLRLLSEKDILKPFEYIPFGAKDLYFPDKKNLASYECIMNQSSNGFYR